MNPNVAESIKLICQKHNLIITEKYYIPITSYRAVTFLNNPHLAPPKVNPGQKMLL